MAIYYLSPTGSDTTGDGSQSTPWKGLQKGINALAAGDTLRLLAGTYIETYADIRVNCKGTEAAPILIEGIGTAIITTSTYPILNEGDVPDPANPPRGGTRSPFCSPADGSRVTWVTWRNLTLSNCRYAFYFSAGTENCTWDDLTITRCLRSAVITGGSDVLFQDCNVFDNVNGLQFGTKEVPTSGIAGITVQDCTFRDNLHSRIDPPLPSDWNVTNYNATDGISIQEYCSEVEVKRCTSVGHADGFDCKPWCVIDRCFAAENYQAGFKTWDFDILVTGTLDPCGKTILTNCVAVWNGTQMEGTAGDGFIFCGGTMEDCDSVYNGRAQLRPNGPFSLMTIKGCLFWGNSFVVRCYREYTLALKNVLPAGGYNVFYRVAPPPPVGDMDFILYYHGADTQGEAYRLPWLEAGTALGAVTGETPVAGCPGTFFDRATCLFVDPEIVDPTSQDCHPLPDSILHGAGLHMASVLFDYDGNSRAPADPVIGAYVGEVPPGVGNVEWRWPGLWWLRGWRPTVERIISPFRPIWYGATVQARMKDATLKAVFTDATQREE